MPSKRFQKDRTPPERFRSGNALPVERFQSEKTLLTRKRQPHKAAWNLEKQRSSEKESGVKACAFRLKSRQERGVPAGVRFHKIERPATGRPLRERCCYAPFFRIVQCQIRAISTNIFESLKQPHLCFIGITRKQGFSKNPCSPDEINREPLLQRLSALEQINIAISQLQRELANPILSCLRWV